MFESATTSDLVSTMTLGFASHLFYHHDEQDMTQESSSRFLLTIDVPDELPISSMEQQMQQQMLQAMTQERRMRGVLIAPSCSIHEDKHRAHTLKSIHTLKTHFNMEIFEGQYLFNVHYSGVVPFCGSIQERASDLIHALTGGYDVIFIARGGYGLQELIDYIPQNVWMQYLQSSPPPVIVGMSDVTHLFVKTGFARCIHYHNVSTVLEFHQDHLCKSLQQVLRGNYQEYHGKSHALNRCGQAQGKILGGNLTIITLDRYSETSVHLFKDCILFVEDPKENANYVCTRFQKLRKILPHVKGLVIGFLKDDYEECTEREYALLRRTAMKEIAECTEFIGPIVFDFPVGHVKESFPLMCGEEVQLNVTRDSYSLVYINRSENAGNSIVL